MKELRVNWYSNTADRFLSLLRKHDWNEAVRLLKAQSQHHVVIELSHYETIEKSETLRQLRDKSA